VVSGASRTAGLFVPKPAARDLVLADEPRATNRRGHKEVFPIFTL